MSTYYVVNFGYNAKGRAKNRHYETLEAAKVVADEVFSKTGVVVAITASPRKPKSFKVGCKSKGDLTWAYNGLRFATKEEASAYGRDLYSRWMGLDKYEVHASSEPVNYKVVDGRAVPVKDVASVAS